MDSKIASQKAVSDVQMNRFLGRTYGILAVFLLITLGVAVLAPTTYFPFVENLLNTNFMLLIAVWLIGLFYSWVFVSTTTPDIFLVSIFAALVLTTIMGMSLGCYAIYYGFGTFIKMFISTAVVFVTMSLFGLFYKGKSSRLGILAPSVLVAVAAAFLINILLRGKAIDFIASNVMALGFAILTAWDSKRMKEKFEQAISERMRDKDGHPFSKEQITNAMVIRSAGQLYLDFIVILVCMMRDTDKNDLD